MSSAHASNGPPAQRLASLSCFFPAFNEAQNLPQLLDDALATLPTVATKFEVIVVDDGSTDGTADLVEKYALRHPEIRLERHSTNRGYAGAVRTGLRSSCGEAIFYTDADRQYRLADIDRLLNEFPEAGIVAGFRLKRSDPWSRSLIA